MTDIGNFLEDVRKAFFRAHTGGDLRFHLDVGSVDARGGANAAIRRLDRDDTSGLAAPRSFLRTGFRAASASVLDVSIEDVFASEEGDGVALDASPSPGSLFNFTETRRVTAYVAYLFGTEQPDNPVPACPSDLAAQDPACLPAAGAPSPEDTVDDGADDEEFPHLADVVLDASASEDMRVLLNGDIAAEEQPTGEVALWVGASVASDMKVGERFTLSVRAEVLWDQAGFETGVGDGVLVGSGTLTATVAPWEHLDAFLDVRGDGSNSAYFVTGLEAPRSFQFTTTLGVSVDTGG